MHPAARPVSPVPPGYSASPAPSASPGGRVVSVADAAPLGAPPLGSAEPGGGRTFLSPEGPCPPAASAPRSESTRRIKTRAEGNERPARRRGASPDPPPVRRSPGRPGGRPRAYLAGGVGCISGGGERRRRNRNRRSARTVAVSRAGAFDPSHSGCWEWEAEAVRGNAPPAVHHHPINRVFYPGPRLPP